MVAGLLNWPQGTFASKVSPVSANSCTKGFYLLNSELSTVFTNSIKYSWPVDKLTISVLKTESLKQRQQQRLYSNSIYRKKMNKETKDTLFQLIVGRLKC